MDPKYEDLIIFDNRQEGKLIQLGENDFQRKKHNLYDEQMLIGRNIEI